MQTTLEKVWKALLEGELTRQYWGHENVSGTPASSSISRRLAMVRLNVTHDQLHADMQRKIANGRPRVLSSLKSFLETGRPGHLGMSYA